jgi:hypothetical protein
MHTQQINCASTVFAERYQQDGGRYFRLYTTPAEKLNVYVAFEVHHNPMSNFITNYFVEKFVTFSYAFGN